MTEQVDNQLDTQDFNIINQLDLIDILPQQQQNTHFVQM